MKGISPVRFALFFGIALAGFTLDLGTKSWIFGKLGLPGGATWWIWPGYFGFQTSLNEGALWGIGQGNAWLFALFSIAAGLGIVYWLFVRGAAQDLWLTCALACITAGILGNLYDRLGLWWTIEAQHYPKYAVRDWILMCYENWVWPNFNIADMLLVCGAGLLVLHAFFTPVSEKTTG
jgi:signal peptidase II